ncbi:hypothetical protein [Longispora albida]|uniref:hypothetical protein n=1 Tax=Longispora albida TaxID=203523 RepID=UPI00036D2D14|nr:hypothetical protein [Longispora albida]
MAALWDIGRLFVVLTAHPLARFYAVTTPGEIREEAATRPGTLPEALAGAGHRMLAGLGLLFTAGAGFGLTALGLGLAGDGFALVVLVVVPALVFLAAISGAVLLVNAARWTLVVTIGYRGFPAGRRKLGKRDHAERRERERLTRRGGPSRTVRWLCTPSWVDTAIAVTTAVTLAGNVLRTLIT